MMRRRDAREHLRESRANVQGWEGSVEPEDKTEHPSYPRREGTTGNTQGRGIQRGGSRGQGPRRKGPTRIAVWARSKTIAK